MKKAFICSAYRGNIEENIEKAKQYCLEVCRLGFLPIAPHLYFPQFLDDKNENQRNLGISFGLDLLKDCDIVYVFGNVTEGMKKEIDFARKNQIMIFYNLEKIETYRNIECEGTF